MDNLDFKSEQLSVFSGFLKEKISGKGWSVKEFADIAGLNEKYAYKLVSPKRDFVPSDETLDKILKALDLPDEEGQYVVDLILLERQDGKPVYPGHPDVPAPPGVQPAPHPQPDPPLPEPQPLPSPPEPHPPGQTWWMQLPSLLLPAGMVSWIERNRKIFIIGSVVLLGLMLAGCCILSVVFAPIGL